MAATNIYSQPIGTLAVGTRHAGFVVTQTIEVPELPGYAYVFRHEATGARLVWLACNDNNKSFAIAFKTPPADDTGTFHILEHSVLCGSDRFPLKEPFVNLLKTSMQTFLNALTFADKTMYPVASTNTADLENLMDVYLDAVLHPAIYHRRRIFEQEGWHYELEGLNKPLTYNGVVFNEMKGALSNPDEVLFHGLDEALFPDTCYRFESGGDPRSIPTLTYEKFLDNHARHYNLANSYTVLYGNVDIERELAFIGERFDGATQRDAGAPNPLELQKPVRAPFRQVKMATAPSNASVGLGYVIGTAKDRERVLAVSILLDAIAGSNEAPLKRAVMDAGLGDDLNGVLYDGELQPRIVFQLKGAKPNVAQKFRSVVEDTCAKLAQEGIERDRLEASLAQAEFNLREGDWGINADGVALAIQVMSSWLYDDDDPVSYLRYEDALAHLHEGLDNGYFEQLLREIVCESEHCAEVELVPTEEGSAAEEATELAQIKSGMSNDQLEAVMAEEQALHAEQEAPDSPEALATLPQLGVADIDPAPAEPTMQVIEGKVPLWFHDLDTHGVAYTYLYFDLRRVGFEELPYVGVLTEVLGELATSEHSAAELDTLTEKKLGSLGFFCETYLQNDDTDAFTPYLVVSASALSKNMKELAELPAEVWAHTNFASDLSRIRDILQQRCITLEQSFVNSGQSAAASRLSTYYSRSAEVIDAMGGVSYYQFLKRLLADFEDNTGYLVDRLHDLAQRIFTADELTVSFTGSAEDFAAFRTAFEGLDIPTAGPEATKHHLRAPEPTVKNEAFIIPSNVAYVVEGREHKSATDAKPGVWQVGSHVLNFDLWNEVRVKGGAYGVGFRRSNSGLQAFWSYRDPNLDATLERYENSVDWLRTWQPSEHELEGYIVSTVATHDAPVKPRQLARLQDGRRFAGRPTDWPAQIREQELSCTAEQIRSLADSLASFKEDHAVCVFGSKKIIESSKHDFQITDLMGSE